MLNPDVQSRVRAEIFRVVGRDRAPGLSDRSSLPFTEATILEIQRLGNIVPFGLPHSTFVSEVRIRGKVIPKWEHCDVIGWLTDNQYERGFIGLKCKTFPKPEWVRIPAGMIKFVHISGQSINNRKKHNPKFGCKLGANTSSYFVRQL